MTLLAMLREFASEESGSTALEYGLIMALIFLAIIGAVTLFTDNFNAVFQAATQAIADAG